MKNITTRDLALCAMMTAVIFVFTYMFKIPIPNGYIHLGDCFIFIAVLLLGRRKGSIAGALGAALADLTGGYMMWILPTFVIKAVMAYVMGSITEIFMKNARNGFIVGALAGGCVQVVLYTAMNMILFGTSYAVVSCVSDIVQTTAAVASVTVIFPLLKRTSIYTSIKSSNKK